jgi:hypothetical protein
MKSESLALASWKEESNERKDSIEERRDLF